MAKAKMEFVNTPAGIASYPWLNKPNTKFDEAGTYDVGLVLDPSNEEVAQFVQMLEEKAEESYQNTVAELQEKIDAGGKDKAKAKAALKKLEKADCINPEYDDEGEETGNVIIKAKMPAVWVDKKTGQSRDLKPTLVDARGNVMKNPPLVYGGSTLKLRVGLSLYYIPATGKAGLSLKLWGAQIIDLVTSGGGDGGFGDSGGTYEHEDTDSPTTDNATQGVEENGNPEDF